MPCSKPLLLAVVTVIFGMAAAVMADDRGGNDRIRSELDSPTQMDFIAVPLEAGIEFLQDLHGIPIQIDKRGLDDAGVSIDTPVTATLAGVSLRSGLDLLLGNLELAWIVRDEVLLVTSAEVARKTVSRSVYRVADLIGKDPTRAAADQQALLCVLRAALGDDATVQFFGRSMILAGNRWQQRTTAQLLHAIRIDRDKQRPQGTWQGVSLAETQADRKIRAELDKPSNIDFIEVPLAAGVDFLKDLHGIQIEVDELALDGLGIGTDTAVTLSLSGVSLRSALDLLLRPMQLTWVIRNEVLLITSRQRAAKMLEVMVYPVGDLAAAETPARLIEVIRATVQPGSWRAEQVEKSGPGALAYLPAAQVLVCANSRAVQEDVAGLLAELRKALPDGTAE